MTPEQGFSKECRLLNSRQFRRVFNRRQSVSDGILVIHGCESDLPQPRLGLSVSRRIGNAVRRNRWKRLIREAYRRQRRTLASMDVVVLPRRGVEPGYAQVAASLTTLLPRLAGRLNRGAGGPQRTKGSR